MIEVALEILDVGHLRNIKSTSVPRSQRLPTSLKSQNIQLYSTVIRSILLRHFEFDPRVES